MRPRVVLLHGFTQTHAHWYRPAEALTDELDVSFTFVDLPGHGDAAPPDTFANDAARLAVTAGPATLVGYSMGGRLALAAALAHPEHVEQLVLIGATAGIDDPAAAAQRRAEDDARATEIERDGVAAFLDRWLALPMFADLDDPGLAERLHNRPEGLAASLRRHGTGSQPSYWDELDRLTMPVLYVVGERDDKFTAIGRRLVAAVPNGSLAVIEGAGHACHLEQPAATARVIAANRRR